MTRQLRYRWPRVTRAPLAPALWTLSAAGFALLLFTDPDVHIRAAYLAAAMGTAMGACTLIIIRAMRRLVAGVNETLQTATEVNESLLDRTVGEAVRRMVNAVPVGPVVRAPYQFPVELKATACEADDDTKEPLAPVVPLPAQRARHTEAS